MFTRGYLTRFDFDDEYVRRLADGDTAVGEHFTAYFDQLLSLKLRGRVRSAQLAADIKQETFMRVLRQVRSPKGIDHPERLGSFVNSVCNNVKLELFRAEGRHPQVPETTPDPPDQSVDLEGALVDDENQRLVRSVLAELSSKDRTMIRMVFLEELNTSEVCAKMHVDRGYLRVLLHRARARLKVILMKRDSNRKMGAGN